MRSPLAHVRDRGRPEPGRSTGRRDADRRDDDRDRAPRPRRRGTCASTGRSALGNRRLAIIDLSPAGHQPMADDDGRLVITYNGELYNFRELRRRAGGARTVVPLPHGHRGRAAARTRSGARRASSASTACSPSPSGTARRRTLFLARDRYGIKPLYYAHRRLDVPLRLGDQVPPRAPRLPSRAERCRTCSSTSPSRTSSRTERSSRASSCCRRLLADRLGGRRRRPRRSATGTSTSRSRTRGVSDEEYAEELDRLFRQAVERQLVSDVPVGAYLSGGMDSGCITAVAAQALPYICDLHRRLRPDLGLRPRARLRRAPARPRRCRTCSRPSTTRRCSRPATWSACLPRARLAPRGSARRPELPELLRRAAREQVREGRALRRRRRRALRRLPVALLPRRRQRRLRALRRQVLRLLAPAAAEQRHAASSSRRSSGTSVEDRTDDRHLPRRASRPRPAAGVAGGVRQLLALPRGEDLPARPAASSRTS